MRTIFGYVKPKAPMMALQLLIKFLGTVIELFLPWMLSTIIDVYVPRGDMRAICLLGGAMTLCAAAALAGNVIANRMATRISKEITLRIRGDLFRRTTALSCAQTDRFTLPSLISRLTSDTYNVHQMIDRMQRLGVRAPILLIGGICVTFSLEPVLTLVLVATLPLLAGVVWAVTAKGVPMYTRTQQALDGMVRKVQENMAGVRVIKALSKTDTERQRFDEANREVVNREQRAGALMAVTNPIMNLLLNLGLTAVLIVGAYRVNAGDTLPGAIIAFMSYFTIILNALMMVTRLFVMYSKGAASARRIEEVLLAPGELPVTPAPAVREDAFVAFDHVRFSYNKKEANLEDVSFALKKGETLGVIGPTGSGKSTLVALLLRFYDADAGQIRIDGRPIGSIPMEELRAYFGVALQNDFLYADTLRENIDFGRGLTDAQLRAALEIAQADFAREKAGGLDAELHRRGSNLSGGQKQRALVARAVAACPDILILDDASSALDYRTDAALRKALHTRMAGATQVIVAQRVSSVMHADHILVLEEGRVIGAGTHAELLRDCPSYREIYEIQMGEVA